MSDQFSTDIRNAWLDGLNAFYGTGAVLYFYGSTLPGTCASADTGSVLAQYSLPTSPLQAASAATATGASLPYALTGLAAAGAGTTLTHFRIKTAAGVCKHQGTIGIGSGSIQVNTTTIASGTAVQITGWSLSAPNG